MLCSRFSFRLSVRQVVSRVILRGSALHYFAQRPIWAHDIDLSVSGHFHGGQLRLPGGAGLFHKGDGFFPKYCYGKFELSGGELIVSRGLGNHEKIPRINNKPELVVIDISHT